MDGISCPVQPSNQSLLQDIRHVLSCLQPRWPAGLGHFLDGAGAPKTGQIWARCSWPAAQDDGDHLRNAFGETTGRAEVSIPRIAIITRYHKHSILCSYIIGAAQDIVKMGISCLEQIVPNKVVTDGHIIPGD